MAEFGDCTLAHQREAVWNGQLGLENIEDIIEDLESGFKALRESGLAK